MGIGAWATSFVASVNVFAEWDGALIAGGNFTKGGGVNGVKYVARWNGFGWSAVGDIGIEVSALTDCNGTLLAGADWDAQWWDGSGWTVLGGGMDLDVNALSVYKGNLFVTGGFSTAGTTPSLRVARWGSHQIGISDPRRLPIMLNAFPNPFRASTTLVFELDRPGPLSLAVFDVQGRRLATLAGGSRPAGRYEFDWDGRNDKGRRLPAGTYYLHLRTSEQSGTRKLVRLR
jgi:hypothetical protein